MTSPSNSSPSNYSISMDQSKIYSNNQCLEQINIPINTLPIDIWKIIFNQLNFNAWKNLLLTNKKFKLICEVQTIKESLLERESAIPLNKKADFVLTMDGPHIKNLNLKGFPLTKTKLVQLLTACPNLIQFDLTYCGDPEQMTITENISSFVSSLWKKNKAPIPPPQALPICHHLTQLNLSVSPFSEQKCIEILKACPTLIHLHLNKIPLNLAIVQHLKDLPNLKTLNLTLCNITPDANEHLKLLNLDCLDVESCTDMTEEDFKMTEAVKNLPKNLAKLNFNT